jgi:oligopeptide transport system substrate-binding protein
LSTWRQGVAGSLLVVLSLSGRGCLLNKEGELYYGRAIAPHSQELRWSDGGLPQVFDPALAVGPPDTDAVRALFEGLTGYDAQTLKPVPGVALRWDPSADAREWTFYLRTDARWSNGDPVTAQDFVRSWQRTVKLSDNAPHARLFENIVGFQPTAPVKVEEHTPERQSERLPEHAAERLPEHPEERLSDKSAEQHRAAPGSIAIQTKKEAKPEPSPPPPFGVEAVSDHVLRVKLQKPDPDFPSLVAHPVFSPSHQDVANVADKGATRPLISNGPFRLTQARGDGVVLERASNYWDSQTVALDRVRFIAARDAETALKAYRSGEIDAISNAAFEPLALKLLSTYKDFRRTTYGALTYYSFNMSRKPFDDVRVREALSISIDRKRISEDETGGVTEPASDFLPPEMASSADAGGNAEANPGVKPEHDMAQDVARAQTLLASAGYPRGQGFPRIRLVVNRNEQQRLVAQSIAAMWRNSLAIQADVVVLGWDEYEAAVRTGDYDIARRGMVMQTTDEASNVHIMFEPDQPLSNNSASSLQQKPTPTAEKGPSKETPGRRPERDEKQLALPLAPVVTSDSEALKQLPAIPVYFASSYRLVKPYVSGFDSNLLDAPSLKNARIDTSWQPPAQAPTSWFR